MPPTLLRLPFWLLTEGFRLDRAIARDAHWTALAPQLAFPRLRLSGPERRFAKELLQQKRNFWLWRCDQRTACGDFAVVDLSSPVPALRRVWLIELKERSGWRAGSGLQLKNWEAARAALIARRLIGPETPLRTRLGSTSAALAALTATNPGTRLP